MEIFHGRAGEETIRVFGKERQIPPRRLNAKVVFWDLDENGQPQKDGTGEIKTITVTSCIVSIDVDFPPEKQLMEAKLLAMEYLEAFKNLPRIPRW